MNPDLLQFHGEELPAFCESFNRPFLKAVRVRPGLDLLQCAADFAGARGLLLDAYAPDAHGGTGRRFDWSLIPAEMPLPVILAGGLEPGNVADAVRHGAALGAWMCPAAWRPLRASRTRRRSPHSSMRLRTLTYSYPDKGGHFGPYGGIYMAETLIPAVEELREQYLRFRDDPEFKAEFAYELKHYVGRPSPIYHAKRLSEDLGGAQIYLKREDLNHTGAHKINNAIGQALLAKRMGKKRVIAETGAGHARRGDRDRGGALRHGMHRLHGRGRHPAPGAQRVPHEAAGRDGGAGGERFQDAQGRLQRGHPRLGDQRREHLLHLRHRGRPAPVPDDGARFPVRDRQRGQGADAGD